MRIQGHLVTVNSTKERNITYVPNTMSFPWEILGHILRPRCPKLYLKQVLTKSPKMPSLECCELTNEE